MSLLAKSTVTAQRLIDAENRNRINSVIQFALSEGVSQNDISDILKRSYISIDSTGRADQIIRNLHGAIKSERDKRLRVFAMKVLPERARAVGVPEADIKGARCPEALVTLITTQQRKNQLKACFAAGTMLYTPQGYRAIESLRVGDLLLSRAEEDATSEISAKRVEEVFVHTGRIWILKVNGREIRTTGEHPFWVRDRGWVNACELVEGNRLLSHDGQLVVVEAIEDTNKYETVYNLRIADYHTYFVGGDDWGFNVWAHNACYYIKEGVRRAVAARDAGLPLVPAILEQSGQPDKPIFARIDELYSPKTEIDNDQRFQDILRDMRTPAGRASFAATGRIHVENLGEPGQSASIPLSAVKVK